MNDYLQIAAFQGHINEGNTYANLEKAIAVTEIAEKRGVDLLAFPESYLHGYFTQKNWL